MPRFLTSIVLRDTDDRTPPKPELMAAIDKHAAELRRSGVMLMTGGLAPSAAATRVRAKNGKLTATDGPFAEATEFIGGFAIMQTKSKEEAVELAKRFLKIHQDVLGPGYEGVCDVREMFGE